MPSPSLTMRISMAGTVYPEVMARRAVRAAYFGFFVDMFEVYLPIAALAPALVYFIPAGLDAPTKATIFSMVFAVSLIARPIGAVIFGYFGDRLGRRRTVLTSVAGFAIATALIALLPGYAAWGAGGIIALTCLRLLDGIFVGGEYTAANPLAMEYSAKEKRGLNSSLIHIGYPSALVCSSLLAALMLRIAPGGDAQSAYAVWGWRIPFLVGAVLAGLLFLYYYRFVAESEVWHSSKKSAQPVKELFSGSNVRRLGQLSIVVSGAWLTLNTTVGALQGVVSTVLGAKSSSVNTGILFGAALAIPLFPVIGSLGQKFGRRPAIITLGMLSMVPASGLYFILVSGAYRDPLQLQVLVACIIAICTLVWALITAYLTESFPTEIRSSGFGVSYSLAAVLPGFYSFYMLALAKVMPYEYTPVVLLALGGLLLTVGAVAGPETRHVDFVRKPLVEPAAAAPIG
jgi:MFS family permease